MAAISCLKFNKIPHNLPRKGLICSDNTDHLNQAERLANQTKSREGALISILSRKLTKLYDLITSIKIRNY